MPSDWRGLAAAHVDRLNSLSLVCPAGFDPGAVAAMASRTLVFHGDQGPIAERVRAAVGRLPDVTLVTLAGYAGLVFADVVADRGAEIGQSRALSALTVAEVEEWQAAMAQARARP